MPVTASRKPTKQNGPNLNLPAKSQPIASAQIQTDDRTPWVVWDHNLNGMLCKNCGRQRVGPDRNPESVKNYAVRVGELMDRFALIHSKCGKASAKGY